MKKQTGATLIVVLLILLVVTIVGVLAIRVALTSLHIATNSQIKLLLSQTADTPINKISNLDAANLDGSTVIDAILRDPILGQEYIFCYKPTSTDQMGLAANSTIIKAGTQNIASVVEGGRAGFCNLATDFGSSRQAVVTQVAISLPTDAAVDVEPGSFILEGTDASGGSTTQKFSQQQRIRVTSTAMLPSYSTSDIATVQTNCFGTGSSAGRINDNNDAALKTKQILGDCVAGYGIPVSIQIQEFNFSVPVKQTTPL